MIQNGVRQLSRADLPRHRRRDLPERSSTFVCRRTPMLQAVKFRVRECYPAITPSNDIPWGWLVSRTAVEARVRHGVGVPPTIQNDTGDVSRRVETYRTEQLEHLLDDLRWQPGMGRGGIPLTLNSFSFASPPKTG